MKQPRKYSFLEAKNKIEAWCAYQERCPFEVQQKLSAMGLDFEDVNVLSASLITDNFLNEQRFAEAFCSGKFRIKKWGRIKITQHLKQKHVSNYSIQKGLQEIEDERYILCIEELISRKLNDLAREKNPWQKKAKTIRFLQSRGFEMDLIQDCYNKISKS
jgi:regulatory protein